MTGNNGSQRQLFISAPDSSAIHRTVEKLPNDSAWSWVYLGRNVPTALQIERWVGKGKRIQFANLLQNAASELREPYIEYVAQLGRKIDEPDWWTSALSGKSPYVSQLFYYASCVRACQLLLEERQSEAGPLVLVAESEALRQSLHRNLGVYAEKIERIEPTVARFMKWPRRLVELIFNRVKFIIREIEKIYWARYIYKLQHSLALQRALATDRPISLIYAVVDHRSLKLANRQFTNTDFADLVSYLERKGQQCITVANIQPVLSYKAVAEFIAQSDLPFWVYNAYLSILDVLAVAIKTAIRIPRPRPASPFQGLDVSDLVWHDQVEDWVSPGRAHSLLYYRAIANWKQAGVSMARYISSFENHIWERVFYAAIRQFYPEAKVVAYQPSRVPKFLTNYFISATERDKVPLPDRIVTSGEYTADLLRPSYGEIVVAGGGFRHQHFLASLAHNPRSEVDLSTQPVILVALHIGLDETVELLWLAYQAFLQETSVRVIFTHHPATRWEWIFEASGISEWPAHFTVSKEQTGKLLRNENCRALIYNNSSTALDAIVLGIPVVQVQSAYWLDMDSLDYVPHLRLNASTPEEIIACVRHVLDKGETFVDERRDAWQQAFTSLFGPVTEDIYDLFLLEKSSNDSNNK